MKRYPDSGITIRINIDKTNKDRVEELLDIFEKERLKNKVSIYFAAVRAINKAYHNMRNICIPESEFYENIEIELHQRALTKGFRTIDYPKFRRMTCGADRVNGYLIDPKGDLYKCWQEVGMVSRKIGKITEGHEVFNSNLIKWLSNDVFEDEECTECRFLPLCMGGCPYERMHNKKGCSRWKHTLLHMLSLYYAFYRQNKRGAKERG